ncbi:MAG: LemA family protein [Firmicutes bacterium]|nr:LemA family protein [Bacillota bacterium]
MRYMTYVIIGVIVLIILYIIVTINSIIKLRNRVDESFSTMDVYLKKRWDLIPSIVEVVKGYSKHENETLKDVISLRNNTYDNLNTNEKIDTNIRVSERVSKLMILAENYPELKASDNFKQLTNQLTQVEDEILKARKYYNANVRVYNTKIEMFPNNLVAALFNIKSRNMFEAKEEEKENIKIEL